jgi:hypothetical protein
MLPISSRPDMNSRDMRRRSHRSCIRSREAVSDRDRVVESARQCGQSSVGSRFVPMVENCAERSLAPHYAYDDTKDGRHPQQRCDTSSKADAAKRGKSDQNDHSYAKANEYLGRSQFSRKIWELRHDFEL